VAFAGAGFSLEIQKSLDPRRMPRAAPGSASACRVTSFNADSKATGCEFGRGHGRVTDRNT